MRDIYYDAKRLAEFYNYNNRFGAIFDDIIESQYGLKNGIIKDPIRYYFFHNRLLNLVRTNIKEGAELIDIGCGMGILADIVYDKVKRYVGVDISI